MMSSFVQHSVRFLTAWAYRLRFLLPFALWFVLFYPITLKKVTLVGDTCSFYATAKFFTDNLMQGTFALWDPFLFWGFPTLAEFQYFGPFNPMWLLIIVLEKLGLSFYSAFLGVYLGYFFIGQIGFYWLAKTILKDKRIAYVAFLILLFSFSSMVIFNNPNSVFIGTPLAWFFYFLVRFWQEWKKKFFVGIILTMMIISNCYLPFYWLTVVLLVIAAYGIFYGRRLREDFRAVILFIRQHFILVLVCVLVLSIPVFSSVKGYSIMQRGDVLALDRKVAAKGVYQGGVSVTYERATALCATAQSVVKQLFFNLDKISPCFYPKYISIFVFCVLVLGAWVRVTRKAFVLFFLAVILFGVALGDQTPLCKVFFRYSPFFKLIHGISTFYSVIGPLLILFAALQLKSILREQLAVSRSARLGVVLTVHGVIWLFLCQQPMLATTHLAVLFSAIFFSLVALERLPDKGAWFALLTVAVLIQPLEVMWRFHDDLENMDPNQERIAQNCAYPATKPQFSLTRPDLTEDFDVYDAHRSYIQMKDATCFPLTGAGYPPRWSYYLLKHFPLSDVSQYTKHKFYLYDRVKIFGDEKVVLEEMTGILSGGESLAVVSGTASDDQAFFNSQLRQEIPGAQYLGAAVTQVSKDFRILHFDVNTIAVETHLDQAKFLVYTDSFQPDWNVYVNGKKAKLYRANIAFKGVLVPAGKNVIVFSYRPLFGQLFYWFALGLHVFVLGFLFFMLWPREKIVERQSP